MSTTTTYYVYGKISGEQFAACNFYYDDSGINRVFSPLPAPTGDVVFKATSDSPLTLLGAVFKTDDTPPPLTSGNFTAAVDGAVTIPLLDKVTRGVILIFGYVNKEGKMLMLFPSSDPQIINDPDA